MTNPNFPVGKIFESRSTGKAKIVEYCKTHHVEVEFLNTGVRSVFTAGNINRGNFRDPSVRRVQQAGTLKVGMVFESNKCGKYEIVAYHKSRFVEVRFFNTGYIATATSGNVRRGSIKDPLAPSIYGVARIGVGKYGVKSEDGNHQPQYLAWRNILQHCYSNSYVKKHPMAKVCTVCDEWLDLQVFGKWWDENKTERGQLTKDRSADVYSPETCEFKDIEEKIRGRTNKTWEFIDPQGKHIVFQNLSNFSAKNGLSPTCMSNVFHGYQGSHKGYTQVL